MIAFRRRTLWEQFHRLVSPSYRRQQDVALYRAIGQMVNDPSLPCEIEGRLIPNGYGNQAL
jgi:hypothetical protein